MSVNANPEVGDIRDLRRAAGLSQERLAQLACCSLSMVRLLESGYQPHSGDVAQRIATVLLNDEDLGHHPEVSANASTDRSGVHRELSP